MKKQISILLFIGFLAKAWASIPLQLIAENQSLHPNESTALRVVGGKPPYSFQVNPSAAGNISEASGNSARFTAPSVAPDPMYPDDQGRFSGSIQIQVTDSTNQMFIIPIQIFRE